MLEVVQLIEKHCKNLPDEICTVNVNPNPLYKLLVQVERGINLSLISIDYYALKRDPETGWTEYKSFEKGENGKSKKNGRKKRWRPWREYKAEMWIEIRQRLLAVMCTHYSKLALTYDDLKRKKRFVPAEIISLLAAHMLICSFLSMSLEEQNELSNETAQQIQYVDSAYLAPHRGPVLSYSMKQFMESLFSLSSRINDLVYHEDLRRYLMLLDLRASMFLLYPESGLVHDQAQYREKFDDSSATVEYTTSARFLSNITALMNAVRSKVSLGTIFPRKTAEGIFARNPALVDAAKKWFLARATRMASRAPSEWVEEMFVAMNLWPAEMEIFRQDYPDDICTPLSVLKKYREARFAKILEVAETPVSQLIIQGLSGADKPHEPLILQLALIEVAALHFLNVCSSFDLTEFIVTEPDLDMQWDGLRREDRPRIVQSFGHFQVYYEKALYVHDSFLSSLCTWFVVMYQKCKGRISPRLTLDEFTKDLFGEELFLAHIKPPPVVNRTEPERKRAKTLHRPRNEKSS